MFSSLAPQARAASASILFMSQRSKIENNPSSRRQRRSQTTLLLPRFLRRCREYGGSLLTERVRPLSLRLLSAGFALSALLLALISIAAHFNMQTLLQTQRSLRQEYQTQAQVAALLPSLREADAAAHATVLSAGSPQRHDTFLDCERNLRERLQALPAAAVTPQQRKQAANLVPVAERYLDNLHRAAATATAAEQKPETAKALLLQTEKSGLLRQVLHQVSLLWIDTDYRLAEMHQSLERAGATAVLFLFLRAASIGALTLFFLGFVRHSEHQKKEKQALRDANFTLTSLAQIDPLTGLNNRRAFDQQMAREWYQAVHRGTGLSLLLLDLDDFKSYNDTYGHLAGDDVLKGAAYVLQRRARGSDFAGRYGGEEFAVLLPRAGMAEATVVAERIRASFETARWPCRPVTVSIGIATYSPLHRHLEDLIHEADTALYRAKRGGRNAVSHADEVTVL